MDGLSGGTKEDKSETIDMPPEAFEAMQASAVAAIAAKAGSRLPIVQGRDRGLPKAPPVFDIEEMKKRNEAGLRKKGK
jgi:hypothetical protein